MTNQVTPHSMDAIEREIDACEEGHYDDRYYQGAVDALMWVLGHTPPPSTDLPDTP